MADSPETDQKIYVENKDGAVNLVTSLELWINRPGTTVDEKIGTAVLDEVRESRGQMYNFTIGNGDDPSTCRDLIPGVVNSSTMTLNTCALFTKNILAALGDKDGRHWMSSLRYQTRPFTIKEKTVHPNDETKVRIIVYSGCIITDYTKSQSFQGGDIRVMENVTVHFKKAITAVDTIDTDA